MDMIEQLQKTLENLKEIRKADNYILFLAFSVQLWKLKNEEAECAMASLSINPCKVLLNRRLMREAIQAQSTLIMMAKMLHERTLLSVEQFQKLRMIRNQPLFREDSRE